MHKSMEKSYVENQVEEKRKNGKCALFHRGIWEEKNKGKSWECRTYDADFSTHSNEDFPKGKVRKEKEVFLIFHTLPMEK